MCTDVARENTDRLVRALLAHLIASLLIAQCVLWLLSIHLLKCDDALCIEAP